MVQDLRATYSAEQLYRLIVGLDRPDPSRFRLEPGTPVPLGTAQLIQEAEDSFQSLSVAGQDAYRVQAMMWDDRVNEPRVVQVRSSEDGLVVIEFACRQTGRLVVMEFEPHDAADLGREILAWWNDNDSFLYFKVGDGESHIHVAANPGEGEMDLIGLESTGKMFRGLVVNPEIEELGRALVEASYASTDRPRPFCYWQVVDLRDESRGPVLIGIYRDEADALHYANHPGLQARRTNFGPFGRRWVLDL